MQLPLRLRGTDSHGQVVDLISLTENVSGGGAYFFHSEPLDMGANVDASLFVSYDILKIYPPRKLESHATIVRTVAPENTHDGRMGIAVKFLNDLKWKAEFSAG